MRNDAEAIPLRFQRDEFLAAYLNVRLSSQPIEVGIVLIKNHLA